MCACGNVSGFIDRWGETRAKYSFHSFAWICINGNTMSESNGRGRGGRAGLMNGPTLLCWGIGCWGIGCWSTATTLFFADFSRLRFIAGGGGGGGSKGCGGAESLPSVVSSNSISMCATCAAIHTPNCSLASSGGRLSVLVSIDTAIGRCRRPSWDAWLIESSKSMRAAMISAAREAGSRKMTKSTIFCVKPAP